MVDNVIMPETVSIGFKGGPTFSTDKVLTAGGQERRLQNWSIAIHKYQWEQQNAEADLVNELREFWFDRRGDFKTFLFKDWADFSATGEQIGVGDGSETDFQITKTYSAGSNPYVRTIRHIKSGTLSVYIDGHETTDFSVSATGLITFLSTVPQSGEIVSADFEFYVPVRLEGDAFQSSIPTQRVDILDVSDIQAVEVIP